MIRNVPKFNSLNFEQKSSSKNKLNHLGKRVSKGLEAIELGRGEIFEVVENLFATIDKLGMSQK